MKTIQLELSESIYDRVVGILALLPENECRILKNSVTSNQGYRIADQCALADITVIDNLKTM